jgi:hypothetical protein
MNVPIWQVDDTPTQVDHTPPPPQLLLLVEFDCYLCDAEFKAVEGTRIPVCGDCRRLYLTPPRNPWRNR